MVFAKDFDYYYHNFIFGNFSSCPVKLQKNWNWNFQGSVWKPLYNVKLNRAQEARDNQSQNNEIFEMFKNNRWINNYYTKSKYLCSLNCLFCFWLKTPFLGKFGPKTSNCQFELNFGTYTNLNMQNSMIVSTFSVLDLRKNFLG